MTVDMLMQMLGKKYIPPIFFFYVQMLMPRYKKKKNTREDINSVKKKIENYLEPGMFGLFSGFRTIHLDLVHGRRPRRCQPTEFDIPRGVLPSRSVNISDFLAPQLVLDIHFYLVDAFQIPR